LDRDLRRLGVADLSNHDDVGVLADDRAEAVREGEPDRRLHVDLVHAEELVLDRILDRDDLLVGRVDLVERTVERRRLAAAGGARDEHHAVRLVDEPVELAERVRREAERVQVHDDARAVEDTEDDALAVERRQRGDAEVDLLAHQAELDAAVLRQATLGDVELRHDLDARDDRRLEPARRALDVVQDPVDAVADLELVLERLDVDVRRALLDRAVDEQVHEADDRRLAREVAEVVDVLFVVGEVLDVGLRRLRAAVSVRRRAVPVRRLEPLEHVALAREARIDLEPRRDLERLDRVVVRRIGHRDGERSVRLRERDHLRVLQILDVEAPERDRVRRKVASRDGLHPEVLREERQQVLLGDEAEVQEEPLEPLAPLLLEPLDLAQVILADAALLEQELLERTVLKLHGWQPGSIPARLLSGKQASSVSARQAPDATRPRQSSRTSRSVSASATRGSHPVSRVSFAWLPTMRAASWARRSAALLSTRTGTRACVRRIATISAMDTPSPLQTLYASPSRPRSRRAT